ncbi:hypothetical protein GCM10028895_29060 [Pontibacter rugosus]
MHASLQHTALAQDVPDYTQVYHPVINQAELSLVDGKYEEAIKSYKEAFAAVPSPFARDYYNAAVSSLVLKEKRYFQVPG